MKYLISLILLFSISCAGKARNSCGFVQNVYNERVTWQDQIPIKIYIDSNFPIEKIPELKASASVWEKIVGRTLFVFQDEAVSGKTEFNKDGKNVIFMGNFDNPRLLGLTRVWWRQDQIKEADIQFANKSLNKEPFIHELGHLLGLMHNENQQNSIMYPNFEEDQALTKTDIENIKCGYN